MTDRIEEGLFAPIHGEDHWVTLRGEDRSNPIVMILGGAGAGLTGLAPLFRPWEAGWTVAQWDQPWSGWTLAKNGAAGELNFARIARDALAVVDFVLNRLGQQKLVLFCLSGGTAPGLMMVRQRPDLFHAYVAQGQVTNWRRQEALAWQMLLDRERAAGNLEAVRELEDIGRPPWTDVAADAVKGKYANAFTPAEAAAVPPVLMRNVHAPAPDASWRPRGLTAVDPYASSLHAFATMKPELAAFDAASLGARFEVPMLFFQGAQDAHTPAAEIEAYVRTLDAPHVQLELLEHAGHSAIFMAERMLALLDQHVRPLTSARRRPSPGDR